MRRVSVTKGRFIGLQESVRRAATNECDSEVHQSDAMSEGDPPRQPRSPVLKPPRFPKPKGERENQGENQAEPEHADVG